MIRRPLIVLLSAYLAGMYFAWKDFPAAVIAIAAILVYPAVYIFMYQIKNKIISPRDKFLWSLPVLFLLGFCSMKGQLTMPKLYGAFDQKISCELSGKISMVVKKQWGKAIYVKDDVVSLSGNVQYLCENVIVLCYDEAAGAKQQDESLSQNYLTGNRITVRGILKKFSEPANPGQFNERRYYQIENIDFKMDAKKIILTDAGYSRYYAFLDRIKNKLMKVYDSILAQKESGTLIAMLLGEKYLLDDEIKQLYQLNGISHVLAISGLHVSLIGMAVFFLLKKLRLPVTVATFLSIFLIYSYGVLTNFGVSTNRAVVMMIVMLLSALFGKTYDMLSALALSALIVLLQNPIQILSVGFLLSFGAVLGIAVIYPCLNKLFPSKNSMTNSLFISISAQITTTPFILCFYYQLPVYGILINLIVLPFVTLLMLTSIIAGIAGAVWLPLGIFIVGGANYILKFYEFICRIGSELPGNMLTVGSPDMRRLFLYTLLMSTFVWAVHKFEKWYSIIIPVVALFILILPGRYKGLEITVLDVGQGDAIYMESKSGTSYLIDGGSSDVSRVGVYRIQPFLLFRGTDCIDYAVITHSDSDHICGLMELIQTGKIKIRNLVLPGINSKDESYLKLETLALKHKITVRYINSGDIIKDGGINLLCLHPVKDDTAATSNAYSTVLSVSYHQFDMLLTGDVEQEGEEQIMELLKEPKLWEKYYKGQQGRIAPASDYDILKVAHHGSRNSSCEELLKIIQPEYSLISCGKGNRYGHPHKELLDRLNRIGSKVLITYESGAVTIKTDGKRMELTKFKG